MPVAHEFEYYKPTTLDEALDLLAKHRGRARVLAGGTDLALKIKEGTETPDVVVDIKGIDALQRLECENDRLFVGARVTFSSLVASPLVAEKFPLLKDASGTVGSVGIRNRATLVGNICSAVPSLDSGPALLVHEAIVHTKSINEERSVPIAEWFVGPKQSALKTGEIVIGISVPFPPKRFGGCYVKLGRYAGEDLAQAGVGILALEEHEYRVAFCAVGPTPIRSARVEALLNGEELTDTLIEEAKALIPEEISPIADIRSSKDYRLLMAKVMFERGVKRAVARLAGEQSKDGAIWI
jgi:CO/xanthine dehydrogenase FAD-binding subunit